MKEEFSLEKEKKIRIPCKHCGKLGHSIENCPSLNEEKREEIRERRNWMKRNIEEDIEKRE
jgi:hypothetical protein